MPNLRDNLPPRPFKNLKDRLAKGTPLTRSNSLRFYLKNSLATEVQGSFQRSILQHEDRLLAQRRFQDSAADADLFASDQQRSILITLEKTAQSDFLAYTPYGHHPCENNSHSLLGFSGERREPVTGYYLLGNGYRAFDPVLMRFNSPDVWSPFGKGGMNAYAYCLGDPVNSSDPSGHFAFRSIFKGLKRLFGGRKKTNNSFMVQPHEKNSSNFLGYHGTSDASARNIINKGVRSRSKGDSFFVTNTFSSASEYASLQKKSAVLAVYTVDFDALRSHSARGVVKQSNIAQLKIPKVVQPSLRFERVEGADMSSNFNRFMGEQESALYWITRFRQQS